MKFLLFAVLFTVGTACDIDYIADDIYISSYSTANDPVCRAKYNITAVLTVMEYPIIVSNRTLHHYAWLYAEDITDQLIYNHFNNTYDVIEDWKLTVSLHSNPSNVLVHCHDGHSRSVAIVIAYLMKKKNYGYNKAKDLVKKHRKTEVNSGFTGQLRVYEYYNNTNVAFEVEHVIWRKTSTFYNLW